MTPEEAREWRRRSVARYQARQKPTTATRKLESPQRARKRAADAEYRVNRDRRLVQARGRCEFEMRHGDTGLRSLYATRCHDSATQTHHVVRRSQRVDHSVENLRALCALHHAYIHAHVEWAKEWGWIQSDRLKIGE